MNFSKIKINYIINFIFYINKDFNYNIKKSYYKIIYITRKK